MAGNQKIVVNIPAPNAVRRSGGGLVPLLTISSELKSMLNTKRFSSGKGFIYLLDEKVSAERFMENLQDACGGVRVCASKRNSQSGVWNFQMAFCEYKKNEKWEDLAEFLYIKKYVTGVVVNGIVPDELKEMGYIIEISSEMCKSMETPEFQAEINGIINFIRENPDVVARELDLLCTSETFEKRDSDSPLFANLLAASRVYVAFYRDTHTDKETAAFKAEVEREIRRCVQRAEELAEEYDAADAIKATINRYFSQNRNFGIFDVCEVNGRVLKAVKSGQAILFDEKFYYVCEPLFKKACGSLLTVLSHIQIKKILREEGILVCNRTENTNFTVKKVLVNEKGQSLRERFIKLGKEFLVSPEGLYLEERRSNAVCRSVKRNIIPAALADRRRTGM